MRSLRNEIRTDSWNEAWVKCLRFKTALRNDLMYDLRHPIVARVWTTIVARIFEDLGQYED